MVFVTICRTAIVGSISSVGKNAIVLAIVQQITDIDFFTIINTTNCNFVGNLVQ